MLCEFSPTTNSLNELMPVACVLVAVRVPAGVADQVGALERPGPKFAVFAPGSRSPATKLSVALYVVKPTPLFVIVQYRLTFRNEFTTEVLIFGWAPATAVAVRSPAVVTLSNTMVAGE